ncbi:hypothetical protein [Cytobacillus dafuensis]|uniref:Uncharacterized protein n=1 Tax=Cytobacillus dafuensis TaxID=1742359 RepID=A0A5B8Z7J0_CYTDA|nr:hypothetical protein [Cytobacillus dafuensis]QED49085.1 hypothetical protein FSZ17_18530 [Cytobacillus dafuensis]
MKRNVYLVLAIIWGLYLVYAIFTYITHVWEYKTIADHIIANAFLSLFILLEIYLIRKLMKPKNRDYETKEKKAIDFEEKS